MAFSDPAFNTNFLIFYRSHTSRVPESSPDVVCIQPCYRSLDNQETLKGLTEASVEFYNGRLS